jgi:hypothetical protein
MLWMSGTGSWVSDLQYGLQKDQHVKPLCCCMTNYKNIRPTLIPWIDWSIHPQTTARHFLTTMQESGHVGSLTLVEIVFVNYVNKGWVVSQGDLHRNTGCDYGGKHFPFVLDLLGFPQENKVHSVALGLRRSLFVQFSVEVEWGRLLARCLSLLRRLWSRM